MAGRRNKNGLTDYEQSFCDPYLQSGEAISSYHQSKYKKTSDYFASIYASEILDRPEVQAYLDKKREQSAKKLEISADRVKFEMARIAFTTPQQVYDDTGEMIPIHKLPPEVAAAVKEYQEIPMFMGKGENVQRVGTRYKYKFWSKDKQLENLARIFNLFEDDRRAGATNITFASIAPDRRQELEQMMDSYYLKANNHKLLPGPVKKVDNESDNGSERPDAGQLNNHSPAEVE